DALPILPGASPEAPDVPRTAGVEGVRLRPVQRYDEARIELGPPPNAKDRAGEQRHDRCGSGWPAGARKAVDFGGPAEDPADRCTGGHRPQRRIARRMGGARAPRISGIDVELDRTELMAGDQGDLR